MAGTAFEVPIEGVSTSVTAFIDRFPRGPRHRSVRVTSMAAFMRLFGAHTSEGGLVIAQYFANGGTDALVTRVGASSTPLSPAEVGRGVQALEREASPPSSIVCVPGSAGMKADDYEVAIAVVTEYCRDRKAFFIVDPPSTVVTAAEVTDWRIKTMPRMSSPNAAIYFPRVAVRIPSTAQERTIPASGTVAGVYARTDAQLGVWKAPAGIHASVVDATLAVGLTDQANDPLNRLGINALRTFPVLGPVVWGSRTMGGADSLASEWKYVPVRRTALFIEQSLSRGLQWAASEPNDEPLWSRIRMAVSRFLHDLFRRGAFQGATPREAYFVKCDRETTTQADIEAGVVAGLVGFAPLKRAEFVVLPIRVAAKSPNL